MPAMPEVQVVVLGDANVDMVLRPPIREKRNPVPEMHGGGTAANVSVGLARLGVPVAFIGAVGKDNFGGWVRDDLLNENVDVQGLKFIDSEFTVLVMAVIDKHGERQIYVWPPEGGPHLNLELKDIDLTRWPHARWLHTTGICLRGEPARESIIQAMATARQLGWKVSLDLNLRIESWGLDDALRQIFRRAIAHADIVFGNADEEIIPLSGMHDPQKAASALGENQRTVIARLGERGALACYQDEVINAPAIPVPVVDTLGAGDAFNAGYIAAQLSGHDCNEAVYWGNTVAALKIERPGARGLPSLQELKAKIAERIKTP